MNRLLIITLSIALVLALLFGIIIYDFQRETPVSSITKVRSGLVAEDSLLNGNLSSEYLRWIDPNNWNFNQFNTGKANVHFYESASDGLHLGVKSEVEGTWSGLSATTINNNASLFHVNLTMPYKSVQDEFITGLKVATSQGPISYVSCIAESNPSGIIWSVQHSEGSITEAESFQTLWSSKASENQSITKECSIITNGDNYLKVYLDNRPVFSSNKLKLRISQPFITFLDVTTPSASQLRYGIFKDYYSALSENVTIINAPINGLVSIIDAKSGKSLVHRVVGGDRAVNIDIGQFHFPLSSKIIVYDSKNNLVASTHSNVGIFGGDVYSVNA